MQLQEDLVTKPYHRGRRRPPRGESGRIPLKHLETLLELLRDVDLEPGPETELLQYVERLMKNMARDRSAVGGGKDRSEVTRHPPIDGGKG